MAVEVLDLGVKPDDDEALHLLATGRGSLAFLLGNEDARFRLFSGCINWDRVVFARLDGDIAGFMAFQWQGKGPYAPKLAGFFSEFGYISGFWRWLFNLVLEARAGHEGFYVYGLKVIPAARRQGVASALMEAAEHHAASLGAGMVELEVYDTNERALAFYRALDYQVRGRVRLGFMRRLLNFSAVLRLAKSVH